MSYCEDNIKGYADIMLLDCGVFQDRDLARRAMQVLDAPRRQKITACRTQEEQWQSLGAGVLARRLLLRHGMDPDDLLFAASGQPLISGGRAYLSLSHAGDYAMAGLSSAPIGVDIERHEKGWEPIVAHYFTAEEKHHIEAARNGTGAFCRLWSRKECLVKRYGFRELRDTSVLLAPQGCLFCEHPLPGYSCVCCVSDSVYVTWQTLDPEMLKI